MSRMIFASLVIIATLGCAPLTWAQETGAYIKDARDEYKIFIMGDSLAGGIWAGMSRVTGGDARFSLHHRFKEGSGLTRPRFYNWTAALPKILASNPMDIAIIMIGANDARGMRDDHGFHQLGTPEWNKAYTARVDQIISILKQKGIAVYWIGLPPMASPRYNEQTKYITALHKQRATLAGVRYIDLYQPFIGPNGAYTDSGTGIDGDYRRLRSRNGVTFIKPGNDKVATIILDVLGRDISAAETLGTVSTDAPLDPALLSRPPLFGQTLADGTVLLLTRDQLPGEDYVAVAGFGADKATNDGTVVSVPDQLARSAPHGSAALRLFEDGEWPAPVPGRFDDFTVTGTQ